MTTSSDPGRVGTIQQLTWKIHKQIERLRPLLMVETAADGDLQDVLKSADEFDTVIMRWTVIYLDSENE